MTKSKAPLASVPLTRLDARHWSAFSEDGKSTFLFSCGPVFVLDHEAISGRFVLPGGSSSADMSDEPKESSGLRGKGWCWVLPESPTSTEHGWMIKAGEDDAVVSVQFGQEGGKEEEHEGSQEQEGEAGKEEGEAGKQAQRVVSVTVHSARVWLSAHAARPHADVHGGEYMLSFAGGKELADALAGFYWGTMLPCVVERTRAAKYPDRDGYVISTLADKYVGTYPDVDHEFQIKGRLAMGSGLDLDVVRRMMELQLRMMREDPQQLWRDPCAVQPDGSREYHVRRNSLDGRENAVMFLVSGNVEIVESAWLYVGRTKDTAWLAANIDDLEGATSCVEQCVDPLGRLWSDVYYEDQVIKDGRETLAAALASRSFALLAALERLLGRSRSPRADHYEALAGRLSAAIAQPLPLGCWDPTASRFVDWVDRSGNVHDHIHLLANELPVLFGAATPEQAAHVHSLLEREEAEFQRFPSFLAARIADYTPSEIGDGGPYDLCAAGRYWCWDAAFWSSLGRGDILLGQLQRVARMGARDGYVMGERYDMNHVYYKEGPPWHGAAHYYEYPCVFAWVLISEYLGVRPSLEADVRVAPRLGTAAAATVTLAQDAYQLQYEYQPHSSFVLRNLASSARSYQIDLGALFPQAEKLVMQITHIMQRRGGVEIAVAVRNDEFTTYLDSNTPVTLAPGAHLVVQPA